MIYKTPEKITSIESQKISNELLEILNSGQDLYIDMANTTYIASAGLRSFLIVLKSARAKGCDFAVCNPNPQVNEIFKITGLSKILPTYDYMNDTKSRLK